MTGSFGTSLPRIVVPPPGPESLALGKRLRRVESRNTTWIGEDFPVFWEAARGANVRDADGNVYIDLTGAFGVAAVGHAAPEVVGAMGRSASTLLHGMGDVHPPVAKVELLERLAAIVPWPETRSLLASTGSEAVEIALKTALLATGRPGILAFAGGYHGLTLGALAATARGDFRAPFERRLYSGVRWAPWPEEPGWSLEFALAEVRRTLAEAAEGGEPIGAVLIEPIQGRAGVRIPPAGFLAGVAEAARSAGALLIFDEIFCGLGRTGRMFAFEHEGVVPDLLCIGKALGGGIPISACLGPVEVMDAWPPSPGEALHTSTFLGHPLACMTAVAVLDRLADGELLERARVLGAALQQRLTEGLEADPVGGRTSVRGRGLFIGIDTGRAEGGVRATVEALRRGIVTLPAGPGGEVVELSPPLVITEEQLEWASDAMVESVRAALRAS